MIIELIFIVIGIVLVLIPFGEKVSNNLFHKFMRGFLFLIGVVLLLIGIWALVAFGPPIEVTSGVSGLIYSIDENNNVRCRGLGEEVKELKWDTHKYRYVYFCPGGGSSYNITETSKDGELVLVTMKPFWSMGPHSVKTLSDEKLKSLVDTYGVDWPQKFLKPSEDWIRNYIRTHEWRHIITPNNDWEELLYYEREYSMANYGFMIWVSEHYQLTNHAKEEAFQSNRDYATLAPIAAAYGVELTKPRPYEDVEEYIAPIPTPVQYNTYYDKEGVLHGDGLYSDDIYYNTTNELLEHLKKEHSNGTMK